MKKIKKILYITLCLIAFALAMSIYATYRGTRPIKTTTPVGTPPGTCGLVITSHAQNGKVSLAKPIMINGKISNTNQEKRGCGWTMSEGQAGVLEVFAYVNGEWKSISKKTPIPVQDWMTTETTFSVEVDIDDVTASYIGSGRPIKIIFAEDNPSGEGLSDKYSLNLITTVGELQ